ncbi:hypothetical protein [Methylobacterium sp. ID0610]|uniref:hypothetical protein n=1 Tax=Methylobacterium carpenticola TaxID=3344827 RepID=UPI00367DEA34
MTVTIAMVLMVIIGITAVVIELSRLYVERLKAQRIADIATMAAAATSSPIQGGALSTTARNTALNIAVINGLRADDMVVTAVSSPNGSGNGAIRARVARNLTLLTGSLFSNSQSATIGANAWAEITGSTHGACAASLIGAVNIYNAAIVKGPSCNLAAETWLYVCHTALLKAKGVTVGYTKSQEAAFLCPGATYSPASSAFTYGGSVTDTLAANPVIIALKARLAAMFSPGWPYGAISPAALLSPTIPSGADRTYVGVAATLGQATRYGTVKATNASLTFTGNGAPDPGCASPTTLSGSLVLSGLNQLTFAPGCYAIGGSIQLNTGASATFVTSGTDVTFAVTGAVTNGTGSLTFGNATYSIRGNLDNSAGGSMTLGAGRLVAGAGVINTGGGTLRLGDGPHYFNGGTITNGPGRLVIGNGAFHLWGGGIANAAAGEMQVGDGPFLFYGGTVTNSGGRMSFGTGPYAFSGGSLTLGTGSTTSFGVGDVSFYGGSVTLGGASMTFGAGGSAIDGSATVAMAGGSFSLTADSLTASGVTFALQGGTVSLLGIGTMNATAPTGLNPRHGYRNVLFAVFGGAFNLYQSSAVTDTLSGIVYAPGTNASIYGKQIVRYPSGGCFGVIAGVVDIYQSAQLAMAPCSGLTVPANGAGYTLVQ